ncbi:LysR family transcriptional regulator [Variovorax paradoxus]|jgi:DNA-binding transcriptional LysR family regulator|uniref:LysR family transcriptional regulator n=1 Tax=Variovorax paradoxus TaxID=34073 RepID=UPI0006E59E43|nr:LysR family transcriptional regulator [Variovorax paradoxus]KPV01427.1 LysR family transcriptional regulator [Variovorax paradoxus]KPV06189.1 LysR family transcriptional regulator [Variovorax paradoxus]KPV17022.1 LysR family transcriptional regulator [Variovorax paradoxus]KPV20660.1 LysR family transcriptional regulator [Variovorax paradoxus]
MNGMHIEAIDLNLLRLFDAVYRARSVSRAAESLGLTQPAASHGLGRLRLLLKDALFTRAPGGVAPTPRAERLAAAVQAALALLEEALHEPARFEPQASRKVFRIHMSDIGEGRFLPALMARLGELAPGVRMETLPLAPGEIAPALDSGRVDFAFGFLPKVRDTQRLHLLKDRYIVLLRKGHPFARGRRTSQALIEALQTLEYVAVRTHAETLRILQLLNLEDRVRLTTEHFMVLPAIVRATDLAVVMPRNIARGFAQEGGYAIVEPAFPLRDFTVSLHWSKRFEADPANRWLRQVIAELFAERAGRAER